MLADYPAAATIPASDMQRAKRFYTDTLGMKLVDEDEAGVFFESGGAMFGLYPTPNAGQAPQTVIAWQVKNVEKEMEALRSEGVKFEEYDMPGIKTENGVASLGSSRGAWFKDSEGNILGMFERG